MNNVDNTVGILDDADWDDRFDHIENWDKEQDLIKQSNKIENEESPAPEYLDVLERCFGHTNFRPMQWKIINSILNDRRDNCSIMATGYGKSLCFQYPSVYLGGVTIVISPLISLMEDQILSLKMCNISACLLGTAQTQKKKALQEIFENKYSLIYLTPEFCCGDYGQDLLSRMNQELNIILIAIDEAHCVSSWGHDFRYQYRSLGVLRTILPNIPILAVTATATPRVRNDIITTLNLRNPQVLCSGFDRPNLQFSVYLKSKGGLLEDLKEIMSDRNGELSLPGSTIIYCITRKQTENTAQQLSKNGIQCLTYHAGMSVTARKKAHENFAKDKVKIIIATIAFGMGIDKPDVRNIIHYGASKDIESYYQEVGRAGRDGQPSNCITFYSNGDFELHQAIREASENVSEYNRQRRLDMERIMLQYLQSRDCRRHFILNHFEGCVSSKTPQPNCCDNCTRKLTDKLEDYDKYEGINKQGLYDFTEDARLFLSSVRAMGGKFGIGTYVLFLRASKSSRIPAKYMTHNVFGSGKTKSEEWWKEIAKLLDRENYLKKNIGKNASARIYSTYSINSKGEDVLNNSARTVLLQPSPTIFNLLKSKMPSKPELKIVVKPIQQIATTSGTEFKKMNSKSSLKLMNTLNAVASSSNSPTTSTKTPIKKNMVELSDEQSMKIYNTLINQRADLASFLDCMPYMIASNEALMQMAKLQPLSVKELRKCKLQGFTEAKLNQFGEKFVMTIRTMCNLDPIDKTQNEKRNIQDILSEFPLPGPKIGATAEASYSLYKSGLTVQEISSKRGLIPSTVFSHLVDAILMGYPVKTIDLNITEEKRNMIVNVMRNPSISSALKIKESCPDEVSIEEIKVVMAYFQVRQHLAKLNVEYEEFETSLEDNFIKSTVIKEQELTPVQYAHSENKKPKLETLLASKRYEKRSAETDSLDDFNFNNDRKPLLKKQKINAISTQNTTEQMDDLAFLDSPPKVKKEKTPNKLDENLLEDDFFDNISLKDMDQVISKAQNEQMDTKLLSGSSNDISNTQSCSSFEPSPPNRDENNINSKNILTEKKLKKFGFKSKIPMSVVKSVNELCNK